MCGTILGPDYVKVVLNLNYCTILQSKHYFNQNCDYLDPSPR